MAAFDGLYQEQEADSSDMHPPESSCGCLPVAADLGAGAGYARLEARSLAPTDARAPIVGGQQQGETDERVECNGSSSERQAGAEGIEGSWGKRIVRMARGVIEEGGVAAGKAGTGEASAGEAATRRGLENGLWDVEAGRVAGSEARTDGESRSHGGVFPYDWFAAPRPRTRLSMQQHQRTAQALRPLPAASSAISSSDCAAAWPSARPSVPVSLPLTSPACEQAAAVATAASYEVVADDMDDDDDDAMSDGACTDDDLEDSHTPQPLCCCCPLLSPAPAPLAPAASFRSSRGSQPSAELNARPSGDASMPREAAGHRDGERGSRRQGTAGEAAAKESGNGVTGWMRGVQWGSRWCQVSIFGVVMLAGLAAAGVVFWATYRSYQQNSMSVLTTLCDTWGALLNERLQDSSKQARLLSALLSILYFRSNPPVLNQSMFVDFAMESRLSLHLFHNVAFAIRLPHAQRQAWEAQNNATLPCLMSESRSCSEERLEYAPILFEDLSDAPHRGMDLYQLEQLNTSVWRVRQQLRPVVSPILAAAHAPTAAHFSPTASLSAHVFKVLPVFRSAQAYLGTGVLGEGVGEGELGGFVMAEMDVDGLWKDIVQVAAPAADMGLQIVDVTDSSAPQLVLDASRMAYSTADQVASGPFARVNNVDFGDDLRHYELRCRYTSLPVPVLPVLWMVLVLLVVAGAAYLLCAAQRHLAVARRNLARMGALKDRMKRAKVLAETGNRAKGTFLATMSHELRTPLNGVIGMMNLLLETPLSATQLDYVETARTSGRALVDLINDILDLSKIEAKRMVLESAAMDMRGEVVDDVLSMFVDRIRANPRVEVAAYVDPAVPDVIFGDSLRLRQVLMNLLSNSCKYTARGHIFISVRVVKPDEDLRRVLLLHRVTSAAAPLGDPSPRLAPHDSSAWRFVSPSALMHPTPLGGGAGGAGGGRLQRAYLGSGTLRAVDWGDREGGEGDSDSRDGWGWASGRDGDSASVCGEESGEREGERERRGYETLSGYEAVESCNSWAHMRMQQQARAAAAAAAASSGMVRLVVSVEDTGEGIPLRAQKSIFKRFVQADASSTRTHGGTGIGLTISRHLVHLMGGKLSFVSRPGIGTTFYFDFTVPFQAPKRPSTAAAAAGGAEGAGARCRGAASSIDSCDCAFTAPPLSPATPEQQQQQQQDQDIQYRGAAAASLGINCSFPPSLSLSPPPPQHMLTAGASSTPPPLLIGEAASPAGRTVDAGMSPCAAPRRGPYMGVAAVVLDDWPVRRAVMHTYLARLGVAVLDASGDGVLDCTPPAAAAATTMAFTAGSGGSSVAAHGSAPTHRPRVSEVPWEALWAPRGMVVVVDHDWLVDRGGLTRNWHHRVEAAAGWQLQQYRRSHAPLMPHSASAAAAAATASAAVGGSTAGGSERGRWFGLPEKWRAIVVLRDAREASVVKQRHGLAAVLIKPVRHSALAGCLGEALGLVGDAAALPPQHTPAARGRVDGWGGGEERGDSAGTEDARVGGAVLSPAVRLGGGVVAAGTGLQQRSSSTGALPAMTRGGGKASAGEGEVATEGGDREGGGRGWESARAAGVAREGGPSVSGVARRGLRQGETSGATAGAVAGGVGMGGRVVMGGGRQKSAAAVRLCDALGGSKFLVVDDNMVNRKVICKMLQRYGVEVEAVEGGAQALNRLQQPHDFVGVFMDVQMPGMNGFQATRAIRQLEATQLSLPAPANARPSPTAATSHETDPLLPSNTPSHAHPHTPPPPLSASAAAAAASTPPPGNIPPPSPTSPCPPATPPPSSHTPPRRKRLLVFALTADIGGGTRERCAVVGMDGYMTKPIEEDQLSSVVLPFFQPQSTAAGASVAAASGSGDAAR